MDLVMQRGKADLRGVLIGDVVERVHTGLGLAVKSNLSVRYDT